MLYYRCIHPNLLLACGFAPSLFDRRPRINEEFLGPTSWNLGVTCSGWFDRQESLAYNCSVCNE